MAGNIEKISVALPTDMANLVRQAVDTGDYASSSEVIREALREWKTRRATRAEALAELRKLWQEGIASGPAEDFEIAAIKQRGRQRLQSSRK
ncbi:addiction module antidote protein, CopG/Arc/MetJ family [mine drainage metagenome]|uniref:Addiction module antidote protein, CopG/Arc/MetJ family n=1 Tax=mine drainage metagenome TaxID=410659 RepID=T1C1R0_9ZZZZ